MKMLTVKQLIGYAVYVMSWFYVLLRFGDVAGGIAFLLFLIPLSYYWEMIDDGSDPLWK